MLAIITCRVGHRDVPQLNYGARTVQAECRVKACFQTLPRRRLFSQCNRRASALASGTGPVSDAKRLLSQLHCKSAGKRGESQACLSYPEREQTRTVI